MAQPQRQEQEAEQIGPRQPQKAAPAPEEKSRKIPVYVEVAMVTLAVILDTLGFFIELIPLIGLFLAELIPIIAIPVFGVWFALYSVSFISGRKAGMKFLSMMGAFVVEMVPILNLLPGITLGVLGILISVRIENRNKSDEAPAKPVVRMAGAQKIALPTPANDVAYNDN